jgi:hypothetical protein
VERFAVSVLLAILLPPVATAAPQVSRARTPRQTRAATPAPPSEPSAYERMLKKEEQEHRELSKCVSDDVTRNLEEISRDSSKELLGSAREQAEARRDSELRKLRPEPCIEKRMVWEQTKTWLITNDPPKGVTRFDPDADLHVTYTQALEWERNTHVRYQQCGVSGPACDADEKLWEKLKRWLMTHRAPDGVTPFDPAHDTHE